MMMPKATDVATTAMVCFVRDFVVRVKITLACTECKQRNYNMTKEKKNHPDRMETSKYCRFCRKHTLHKEHHHVDQNIAGEQFLLNLLSGSVLHLHHILHGNSHF